MKINPLYIGLLLVIALFFAVYQLDQSKQQLHDSKIALLKVEEMAQEIDALKQAWDNPKTVTSALNRILKSPQLKSANIQKIKKRGRIVLSSKKANLKATNYFFIKLFNGAFILQNFDVKRLDDESLSFHVEIEI